MYIQSPDIFQFTIQSPSVTKLPYDDNMTKTNPRRRKKIGESKSCFPSEPTTTTKDEVEENIVKAFHGVNISNSNPNLFPQILEGIQQQHDFYQSKGFMKEADNSLLVYQKVKKDHLQAKINDYKTNLKKEIIDRITEAKSQLSDISDKSAVIEMNMQFAFQAQKEKLEEKHQKELINFEKQWSSINKQRMYNKTSTKLKELRRQEDLFIDQHFFQDAIEIKKEADKIEEAEVQQALEQMNYDYYEALRPIKVQQKQEMKTLLKAQQDEKRNFENAKQSDMNLINQRIKKLNIKLNQIDSMNSHQYRFMNIDQKENESPRRSNAAIRLIQFPKSASRRRKITTPY